LNTMNVPFETYIHCCFIGAGIRSAMSS